MTTSGTAGAAATAVPLATAESFAVLAGSGITNTGPTTISGDVGTDPTPSITGQDSITLTGTYHQADAVSLQAKNDLGTAYNNAAGQARDADSGTELGGQTLVAGVYGTDAALGLTGALTLDGGGRTDGVWIFQTGSTLITASSSSVVLTNGAQACNVFWQVGSSATLGTATSFVGTIMAQTSISATTGATIQGRLLARDGAVTLDTNTISRPGCDIAPPTSTETTSTATTSTATTSGATTSQSTGVSTADTAAAAAAQAAAAQAAAAQAAAAQAAAAQAAAAQAAAAQAAAAQAAAVTASQQVPKVPVGSLDTGDGSSFRG